MCCNSFVVIRTLKGFHILISLSSATVTKCIRWRCHECRAVTCTQCHAVSRITPGQECPETRREWSTLTSVTCHQKKKIAFNAWNPQIWITSIEMDGLWFLSSLIIDFNVKLLNMELQYLCNCVIFSRKLVMQWYLLDHSFVLCTALICLLKIYFLVTW